MKIPDLKILRIYGQEIERKVFPVPDKVTLFRSKRVAVQLKADEDLKDVSLHHVIRSAECPFAAMLKDYDEEFRTFRNSNAPRKMIDDFNKVTTSRLIFCNENCRISNLGTQIFPACREFLQGNVGLYFK